MNSYTILFGMLLYLAVVNARHFAEISDTESSVDDKDLHADSTKRIHGAGQSRHKRRSWQMNYGYEYPQPPIPFNADRRDYDTQQNLMPHILRLLDEISAYIRRPPPPLPPQPIYVPYPVPYPVQQNCQCPSKPTTSKPSIENRFPEMDDTNQNWGFVDTNDETDDDEESDGSRPISFNPIMPSRPGKRPTPKLDHGSTQAAMNSYTILFGMLLYLAVVNARHFAEISDTESSVDDKDLHADSTKRIHGAGQSRHKRRSWQMNYGYEYPQPPIPFNADRRDYDTQQNLMPHILRLLDEISAYIRRPPPPLPPQPIYVPYPVPYPVQQNCQCPSKPTTSKPSIENRFPEMDDTNQNWGFVDTNDETDDDEESDGSRPISFNPIMPSRPGKRPTPKLDHGSTQAAEQSPPELSVASSQPQGRVPGMCDVFSLSCCRGSPQQQRQCFTRVGCAKTFDNGNGCDKKKLLSIVDAYSKEYSPVN